MELNINHKIYLLCHWLFSWNQDENGDLVFSIAKILHFVKYKEHTLVKFGRKGYKPAHKWQGVNNYK